MPATPMRPASRMASSTPGGSSPKDDLRWWRSIRPTTRRRSPRIATSSSASAVPCWPTPCGPPSSSAPTPPSCCARSQAGTAPSSRSFQPRCSNPTRATPSPSTGRSTPTRTPSMDASRPAFGRDRWACPEKSGTLSRSPASRPSRWGSWIPTRMASWAARRRKSSTGSARRASSRTPSFPSTGHPTPSASSWCRRRATRTAAPSRSSTWRPAR